MYSLRFKRLTVFNPGYSLLLITLQGSSRNFSLGGVIHVGLFAWITEVETI